jgi:hypothetical protein
MEMIKVHKQSTQGKSTSVETRLLVVRLFGLVPPRGAQNQHDTSTCLHINNVP